MKIVHNAEPLSKEKYERQNAYAILEINGGECEKFGIREGDTVVHPKFNLSSENQYMFHNFMFNKLKSKTFNKMNIDNVAFVACASGGAMGWGGACQFFTKESNDIGKYMITSECISSEREIDDFFKTMQSEAWKSYNLGMGNRLYIKSEYFEQFTAEVDKLNLHRVGEVYQAWCRIAYNILVESRRKTHNNTEHWIKQRYYGIDTVNINKVTSAKWWENLEYNDFDLMVNDGEYLDIIVQNTDEIILDLAIENCQNKEILEVLKYYKEKKYKE